MDTIAANIKSAILLVVISFIALLSISFYAFAQTNSSTNENFSDLQIDGAQTLNVSVSGG